MATVSFEHAGRRDKFSNKKTIKPYIFKKKKKPLVLVFDEKAREDFLTGFQKRKLLRKKEAQEKLIKELKEEKTRIRKEVKNAYSKLVVSHRDIPELADLHEDSDIVDMGTHQVQITELDADKLARDNNWIGPNHAKFKEEENEEEVEEVCESSEEIEGMETVTKKKKKHVAAREGNAVNLKTEKDVKKFVKKIATKTVQKSKVFQKKKDVEARKNKKRKMREDRKRDKDIKMKTKKKGGRNNKRNK